MIYTYFSRTKSGSKGVVKTMLRHENIIRPRRSGASWAAAVSSHQVNTIPVFKIGEFGDEATMLEHYREIKYNKSNAHKHKNMRKKILTHVENYCEKTTLHGLRYVGDPSLSFGERIFWLVSFAMAVGFAGYYIYDIFQKWNTSPVIISFRPKDADLTSIPFPAITICNMNQAKRSEAERIIQSGTVAEKKLLSDSCKRSVSYNDSNEDGPSWETVQSYLISVGQGCDDMLKVCKWKMEQISCDENFNNDLTDEGLCCSFNRLPPKYIYNRPDEISILNQTFASVVYDWTPEKGFENEDTETYYNENGIPKRPLGAGVHLGLTLVLDAQVDNYFCSSTNSIGFKMVISNPIETPKVQDFGFLVSPGTEARYRLVPTIRMASDKIRGIEVRKRQCYFSDERPLLYYKHYNFFNCRFECESNYTYQLCGCVPHYFPKSSGMKICSNERTECVKRIKERLLENKDIKRNSCNCLPNCQQVSYTRESTYGELSTGFNNNYDGIRANLSKETFLENTVIISFFFDYSDLNIISKSELYDFAQFLSYAGGLFSLCLGFSCVSIFELLYHAVVKWHYLVKKMYKKFIRPTVIKPTYSERNCRLECQSNYTLEVCNCIPHFLPGSSGTKRCGKGDDQCVNKAKEDIELVIGNASSCHCLQGCSELTFSKVSSYSKLSGHLNKSQQVANVSEEYFMLVLFRK